MNADQQLAAGHIALAVHHFRQAIALIAKTHTRRYATAFCLTLFDRYLAAGKEHAS